MSTSSALRSILSAGLLPTAAVSAALGICFHLSIRTVEIDYRIWRLTGIYALLLASLTILYANLCPFTVFCAIKRTSVVSTSFNVGLTCSILVYRLFFHRLGSFPGPLGAKLSRVYASVVSSKSLQYHLELARMHEEHGDVVRTGPREISINRASAISAIYGPQSACRRSTWYSQVSDDVTKISLNSCRDWDDHRRRRRAWDRGLGVKALATYEPMVKEKVDVFISQLRNRQGQAVDATQWTMFLTFDIMGKVGFGKDFRQLENGTELPAIKGLHDQMGVLGVLSPLPWLLSFLGSIPGLTGSYGLFMDYCAKQVDEKRRLWDSDRKAAPTDIFSWLLKATDENDQSAPPGEGALNEDSRLIIIAGSDTTAVTLANALHFLVTHPSVYKHLQSILDEVFPAGDSTFEYEKVRNIPYLEGIINETLRLKPSVPSGQPRVTPAAGLQIDEFWIPGDVNVIVPQYVIQRDERYFYQASQFLPERWMASGEKARYNKENDAYFPFQIGVYGCAGKQLALLELRSALARIALNFDMSFAPGENGVQFDKGAKDTFVFTLDQLQLVFTERSR